MSFPVINLQLGGFPRQYRVVASCHHRGSLKGGHWFAKVCTALGWSEFDDLKSKSFATNAPGIHDNTVGLILLIAENKL